MVIGKRFDHGNKGYLTPEEKEEAIKAIKAGYEKNFKWGLEAAGKDTDFRTIQKRGSIIGAEDFRGLEKSYPEFDTNQLKYNQFYEEPDDNQQ